MSHPPLLFLDTETLGLDDDAPVWELAAVRVDPDGTPIRMDLECFVQHYPLRDDDSHWAETLPKSFADDYRARYDEGSAMSQNTAMHHLLPLADGAIVVGSNPDFDMKRIKRLCHESGVSQPNWHYHPLDIATLAHGYLIGKGIKPAGPWKSDLLAQFCGIDGRDYERHTAAGDVAWMLDWWKAIAQ